MVDACGPDVELLDFGYLASEAPFTVPVDGHPTAGLLAVPCAFYEFLPAAEDEVAADAPTLLFDELEPGGEYQVVLTAANGLYRYLIGDLVRVLELVRGVPRLEFVGRGNAVNSFTAEKRTLVFRSLPQQQVPDMFKREAMAVFEPSLRSALAGPNREAQGEGPRRGGGQEVLVHGRCQRLGVHVFLLLPNKLAAGIHEVARGRRSGVENPRPAARVVLGNEQRGAGALAQRPAETFAERAQHVLDLAMAIAKSPHRHHEDQSQGSVLAAHGRQGPAERLQRPE